MNFNKIIRNKGNIIEKIKKDALTKLLISQLLSVIECQTWFLVNAKTHHVYKMIQNANSFKNIDETIRNSKKKIQEY